ncbi:hypothetical protein J2125_000908 [Erwinia toletana]|uniref:Uncharacterized protein n=1 Tax=Winslowiella toletana TaxID=92490 RepID=A0ABS4P501_9GAMM|nr:hypothetical protein [Winslowiella toletana]MBP2167716.1 hypothetical protein [Winslowiella toletana]
MAVNNIKPFAIGSGANVISQTDYEALAALVTGFQAGKASSAQINKALRQSTFVASVLAQFISDKAGVDVLDNGSATTLLANFITALKANSANDFLQKTNNLSEFSSAAAKSAACINLGLADTSGYSGRLLNIAVITSSGTYTPTTGTKKIKVTAVGGGGGSGGVAATSSTQYCASGGGAGGSSAVGFYSVSAPVLCTIGSAGGAGAAGNNPGGTGGATIFGSLITAPGGSGSAGVPAIASGSTAVTGNAAPGAIATGGTILNVRGTPGGYAFIFPSGNVIAGSGGNSLVGAGGFGQGFPPAPSLGTGYGSGASGISIGPGLAANSGVAGTAGVVIIEEYA